MIGKNIINTSPKYNWQEMLKIQNRYRSGKVIQIVERPNDELIFNQIIKEKTGPVERSEKIYIWTLEGRKSEIIINKVLNHYSTVNAGYNIWYLSKNNARKTKEIINLLMSRIGVRDQDPPRFGGYVVHFIDKLIEAKISSEDIIQLYEKKQLKNSMKATIKLM